jgi:Phosphate transporter family
LTFSTDSTTPRNSIATIVSTRVLKPIYAVFWAAAFNFIAFLFFGLHVAETLGTGIVAAGAIEVAINHHRCLSSAPGPALNIAEIGPGEWLRDCRLWASTRACSIPNSSV